MKPCPAFFHARAAGLAAALAFLAAVRPVRAQQQDENLFAAIYVRVNGVAIPALDVIDTIPFVVQKEFAGPTPIPNDPAALDHFRFAAVREQVIAQLVLDDAKLLNLKPDPEAVREAIDVYLKVNKISETLLRPAVRRLLEVDTLIDQILVRRAKHDYWNPPPDRMYRFYLQNREKLFRDQAEVVIYHIYIAPGLGEHAASVREPLERIRNDIAGQPTPEARLARFREIARRDSQDQFAAEGGLIGFGSDPFIPQEHPFIDNENRQLFPDAMLRGIRNFTRGDELSPVILSERGGHLLYCERMRGGQIRSFKDAHPAILHHFRRLRRQEFINDWLREKHRTSLIYWNDNSPYELADLLPAPPLEPGAGPRP